MGRLKIIQEDDSVKRIAYLEDVQPLAEDLDDLIDEVENKVDKVEGKSLLADAEITRLSGIETSANKTTIANTLTETVAGKALDATQGKVLSEKIGDLGDLETDEQNSLVEAVNENVDKIENLEDDLAEHKEDYVQHLASEMPHLVRDLDNDKTYRFGLRVKDGNTQLIYEEVM